MKKVSILCANMRGNLGDYAIIDATSRFLNSINNQLEIHVAYHGYTNIDECRTEEFLRIAPKNIKLSSRTKLVRPKFVTKFLKKIGFSEKLVFKIIYKIILNSLNIDKNLINTIKDSNLVIIAGGGHYGSPIIALNMLAQIELAKKSCETVICFPQSVPTNWTVDNSYYDLIKNTILKLSYFPLREDNSFNEVSSLSKNVKQIPDIVFSLKDYINIEKKTNKIKKVGLVFANTGSRENDSYVNKLIKLYKKIESINLDPIIITTTDDVDFIYLNKIHELDRNIKIEKPTNWLELIELFSSLDLIFTNRFHGVVFSILSETAVIPVTDVSKTKNIFEMAELEYSLKNEFEISEELINKYFDNIDKILNKQNKYLEKTKEQFIQFKFDMERFIIEK